MNQLSDARLLRQFIGGNNEAFGKLFLRHAPYLHQLACKMLYDDVAAEEAVWKVYQKFHMCPRDERAKRFKIHASVGAYLRGAVRYACLDHMRKKSWQVQPVSLCPKSLYESREQITPDKYLVYKQLYNYIHSKLGKNSQEGKVFSLRMAGYKSEEIAKQMQISKQNVYSTWHRARGKAQGLIEQC